MRKLLICTAFRYIFSIFLSGYYCGTIQDIKFSAFLSFVKATKCVKLQSAGCIGFKIGIFWISPISLMLNPCPALAKHTHTQKKKKKKKIKNNSVFHDIKAIQEKVIVQ